MSDLLIETAAPLCQTLQWRTKDERDWGDESWNALAYDKNLNLFGEVDLEKVSNPRFAEEYRKRLQNVAGFKRVPAPLPMRNSKGSTVYYLFFASHKGTAEEIVRYIFDKFGRQRI